MVRLCHHVLGDSWNAGRYTGSVPTSLPGTQHEHGCYNLWQGKAGAYERCDLCLCGQRYFYGCLLFSAAPLQSQDVQRQAE